MMSKYFLVGGLLVCLGLCGGCEKEVADPTTSEFEGEDLDKQMEAMEAAGEEEEEADEPAAVAP